MEELTSLSDHNERKAAIYTDSKVTLASLRNNFIHSPLIVLIRNKIPLLMNQNWSIHFGWVKAHSGIEGNELADKLAKEAAEDDELNIVYNKIPTTVATELKKDWPRKWQRQWEHTKKRSALKIIRPDSGTDTRFENTNNTEVHSYCLWSWKKIISTQVQINK